MPFVKIDLRQGQDAVYVQAIGDGVHEALLECFNVPVRDHFQVIHEHAPDKMIYDPHYLEVERSDKVVFIQVTLSAGRTSQQKQAFYSRVTTLLQEKCGLRPQDVLIVLIENTREDWSFGNGEAQYVIYPKEQWK